METNVYKQHTVGVVVPAHNEQGLVSTVIDTMPEFVDRIYVIDDRSDDGTWAEIQASAAKINDTSQVRTTTVGEATDGTVISDGGAGSGLVVPVRHEVNKGVGGAIKTGYLRARADGIDVTAVMAGDGQMDPGQLHRLIDPIVEGEADYAKGNRLSCPDYREGMSSWRLFGNSILTFLTKIASGYWKTMDPQNGYTAIATPTLAAVDVEDLYEYYGYCTDLLIKLNVERARVADVAMPARYGEETSSIKYEEYITKVSLLLLRGFLWRLKTRYLLFDFHPVAFLYGLGALTTATGLLESLGALRRALLTDRPSVDPGAGSDSGSDPDPNSGSGPRSKSLTHSALTFGVGCVLLILSMIFDMEANEDLETRVRE